MTGPEKGAGSRSSVSDIMTGPEKGAGSQRPIFILSLVQFTG